MYNITNVNVFLHVAALSLNCFGGNWLRTDLSIHLKIWFFK